MQPDRAGRVAVEPVDQLGMGPPGLLQLGGERHPVVGHPLTGHPCRLVLGLVAVVGPDRLGRRHPGPLHRGLVLGALRGGLGGGGGGGLRPGPSLLDHGGGDHPASRPHPPSRRREPIAFPGHHHQIRSGQGQVDGLGPATRRTRGPGQERVERGVETGKIAPGPVGADVPPDRLGARRDRVLVAGHAPGR